MLSIMMPSCKKENDTHTHTWKNATCTSPKICEVCGEKEGTALSHIESNWKIDKPATCKEEGKRHIECTACHTILKEESIPTKEHTWVDATCTAPKTCEECGEKEGAAVAHTESNFIIDTVATCTSGGKQHIECTICHEVLKEETIPQKDHSWVDATCTEPKTCSICGKNEGTPMNHDLSNWVVVTEPTYDVEGIEKRTCSRCDYFENQSIAKLDPKKHIQEIIALVNIPTETMSNIELPTEINDVSIEWTSSNPNVLSETGVVKRSGGTYKIKVVGKYSFHNDYIEKEYTVVVKGYTALEKLQQVMDSVVMPSIVTGDLKFKQVYDYGILGSFQSSNEKVINNNGKVYFKKTDEVVTLTLTLTLEEESMTKDFTVTVPGIDEVVNQHQLIFQSGALENNMDKLEIVDGKLVLKDNILEAMYESPIIETQAFRSLVASWAAITSKNATVELKVKAQVNGTWSEYITYGKWGLGLQNESHDQNNGLIKLSTDEVMVINSTATAIQYQVILRRTLATTESPKLSLVSFALEIPGYSYYVDTSELPKSKCYEVPRLNQNVVPTIGNIICSATSTTMLLKYKGLDFTEYDKEYEHRYIASIVKDYGNNIYGNWVYNTVTMGGYGFDAYVARMYSIDELIYHLATVGPVALSVKGKMVSSEKTYTTNGHLIVAIGYKYVDGKLYILCNDPNVPNVYCEYSEEVIKNTWRQIAYVIQ